MATDGKITLSVIKADVGGWWATAPAIRAWLNGRYFNVLITEAYAAEALVQ